MRYVIAGTAGHIDHGKSALVKALTGTDPDRLKEEKLRGITIDLGFAHLKLGDLQIGFVDVPGHEKFVKNMLAGVGGIDFVLLVIAADESVMPQTREHFDICRLLGIQAGMIVITKKDLVESDLVEVVREEVEDMARGSFLEGAPVVVVSSKTGEGMEGLRHALHEMAATMPSRSEDRRFRLPIDRAFSVRGFGTVVTGTLTSGRLLKDSEVELIPTSATARVRGIQVYGRASDVAVAGQRTAVNLQGVDLEQIGRGMVLADPRIFTATQILDARLNLLPGARPLKNLLKVRFHHGTAETLARVALLGSETLEPGASAYAQLRLESPTLCLHGDAFIIRQFSPAVTIGGGRILNPHPVKHRSTDKTAMSSLEILERGSLSEVILAMINVQSRRAVDMRELNSLFGVPEAELSRLCTGLANAKKVIMVPAASPVLVLPETAKSLETETLALLAEFHEQNPLQRGLSREELRKRVYGDLPQEVFRFILDRLVQTKRISLQEEVVGLYGREVQLSAREEATREKIEAVFRQAGVQPPVISELAAAVGEGEEQVRRIYFWMVKQKMLIKVSEELSWHRLALEEIKNTIRLTYKAGDTFGVAAFKELFGMTRKHAIPLLEYLDRERITRRQGNDRILL
jgi:selenocysteine-specific elongation factor